MYFFSRQSDGLGEPPSCGAIKQLYQDIGFKAGEKSGIPAKDLWSLAFQVDCLRGGGGAVNRAKLPDHARGLSGLDYVKALRLERARILAEMDWLKSNPGSADYKARYEKYFADFKRWQQVLSATKDLVLPGMAKAAAIAQKQVPNVEALDKWWRTDWVRLHKQLPAPP